MEPVTVLAADALTTFAVPIIVAAISSGLVLGLLKVRPENAKITVDREQILEQLQREVLERVRREYSDMAEDLDRYKAELQAARTKLAERDLKVEVMSRELERLHDEVIALRAQLGLGRRRTDPPAPLV